MKALHREDRSLTAQDRWPTISITPAAFAAIASTLPKGSTVAGSPDDDEGYLVTLDQNALDRLRARRRRGESYSDAIPRLAKG
jgi:hypothetical protein